MLRTACARCARTSRYLGLKSDWVQIRRKMINSHSPKLPVVMMTSRRTQNLSLSCVRGLVTLHLIWSTITAAETQTDVSPLYRSKPEFYARLVSKALFHRALAMFAHLHVSFPYPDAWTTERWPWLVIVTNSTTTHES